MKKYTVIGIIAILALMVMGATAVLAQSDDATPNPPAGEVQPPIEGDAEGIIPRQGQGKPGGKHGLVDHETRDAIVADLLGISVEELEAAKEEGIRLPELAEEAGVEMETIREALQAAEIEAINEAVANGDMTQEQADEILARMELKGVIKTIFDRDMANEIVADVLGISVEELQAAKEEGVRLPELAEEAGVDEADIRDAVETAKADAFAQAVADGLLTQEQADEALSHGGPGGHGGPKGGHGGPGGGQGRPQGPNGGGQPPQPQGTGFNGAPGSDA